MQLRGVLCFNGVAAGDARVELERKEAAPLAWIVLAIDSVVGRIAKLLQRLAS